MLKLRAIIMSLALVTPFVANATEMELVLEVGRDNSNESAISQDKIDGTEKQTDKIINEWKVVSKQVEGLKIYNEQKRIQIQAQLELMDKLDDQLTPVSYTHLTLPTT